RPFPRRSRSRTRTSSANLRSLRSRFTARCSRKTRSRPPSATGKRSTESKSRSPKKPRTKLDGSMATLTTTTTGPATATIHLTEKAAKKIRALLEKDGVSLEVGGLRVGVQGGGCSGLSYAMRLDTQARDRDKVFEAFGARVFVDPKSLLYLNGTT